MSELISEHLYSQRGFTTLELVIVMVIIAIMGTVGIGVYRVYATSAMSDRVERDLSVIMRGMTDRWLEGTACSTTLPSGTPVSSPLGASYTVACLQNGFSATVSLPNDVAAMVKLPNKETVTIDANNKSVTTSLPAPFIGDGGFEKKRVYGQ